MKIGIGVIAYNVSKELQWLIDSICDKDGLTTNGNEVVLFLHQHSTREKEPEVTAVCESASSLEWVRYTYHGKNRGLSASWNDALVQGYDVEKCDVVLLVNDDITFLPGALDTFAEYAIARRDAYMVTVLGYHHHYAKHTELGQQPLWGFGFSCFAVNPIGWETIGCFDENIAPIYFEDCDFGQRGYLAGLHMAECKTAGVIHWGSLSAKQDGQAAYLETKNPISAQYYTQKWGCLPGNGEQFTRPFNDDALPLYISPKDRHQPFGGLRDRYDIDGRDPEDEPAPAPFERVDWETGEGSFTQIEYPADADRFPIFYEAADDQHRTETRALLHLCAQTTGCILEIGTHVGVKAMELAKNFPNRTIITIDWTGEPTMVSAQVSEQPKPEEVASRCDDLLNAYYVNVNSRELEYDYLVERFGRIGLIFIDGDHSHDGVQRDTELAMAYARDNGTVIAWHDYQEPTEGNEWIGVKDVLDYWVKDQSLHLTEIKGTRTAYTTQWAHPTVPEPQQMPQGYVQPKSKKYAFRDYCGGNSIWDHMVRLADLAAECNGVIVEVGSGCGDGSTHAFDLGLAENPNEYKRHISVNLHPVGGGWEPERSYWSFVQGDSREDDTVYEVQKMLPHENTTTPSGNPDAKMVCPGIIYIDTEHSYECLKRELEIWPDIGDEKTLYVFHDTVGFPHMTQAILEAVAPGGRFHETHDYKLLWHTCSGLSALVPKAGWGR